MPRPMPRSTRVPAEPARTPQATVEFVRSWLSQARRNRSRSHAGPVDDCNAASVAGNRPRFSLAVGVHAPTIRQLGTLAFLAKPHHLLFIGKPGVGKTGLATGIVLKALENGHRALFIKAQDLFDEMWQSLADRSSRKLIDRLMNIDLLLIDEMGFLNLKPEQSNMFFKLMEERYRRRSTIITTNLDFDEWYDFLGRKDMVAALLDRIKHHCTTIKIDGPSLRNPENP